MGKPNYFNDSPISSPKEDQFGISPFAQALAKSFRKIKAPIGVTIALNGPWGSGKSSAVNLVRHYLKPDQKKDSIEIIEFKCWWFRGEEALTLAFLQELHAALPKDLVPKIGKSLLQARPIIGPAVNLATGGVLGAFATGSADFAKRFFSDAESIESLFQKLSTALAAQDKRFLVIIDDIDRLTPDEALLIFQLIKSVGRLPNIMYLVVFDRELAEKAVQKKYPTEGPHFLEKIIQASFELPLPSKDDLNSAILSQVQNICGDLPNEKQLLRFMNVFYDAISPHLETPRDVARIANAISVSWPPVAGEVNIADFVALEVMRLFEPKLYNSIRRSSEKLCGVRQDYGDQEDPEIEIKKFLKRAPRRRRDIAQNSLTRLFPRLRNMSYGTGFLEEWEADRRVCIDKHFNTYFKMALGDETLSIKEIENFIQNCGKKSFVKRGFRDALKSIRKNRKSQV
ncbi:MAG: KAP family P-loop NTPase fold protein, partial [Alphaproteobacteria bacterium]